MSFLVIVGFVVENWEVIGLMLTNLVALFVEPPKLNILSRKEKS